VCGTINSAVYSPNTLVDLRHARPTARCDTIERWLLLPGRFPRRLPHLIGYYLKYRAELCDYFKTRELELQALLADHPEWSPAGLRECLKARKTWRSRVRR
jgi:hypothetical protein